MAWIALPLLGGFFGSILWSRQFLYLRTRFDSWEEKEWPIQFANGISYVYDQPESKVVILFSHGNAGNLTNRSYIRKFCQKHNLGLLLYDYYGYGVSQDVPTWLLNETHLYSSIDQVYHLLSNKKIIVMGESLGCHPSCWLASSAHAAVAVGSAETAIIGLILAVPFDNLNSLIGYASYAVGNLDNLEFCKKIACPTLIISADQDELMPSKCGKCLYESIQGTKHLRTISATHNTYFTEETQDLILKFIHSVQ